MMTLVAALQNEQGFSALVNRPVIYRSKTGLHYGKIVRAHAGFFEVKTPTGHIAVQPEEIASVFQP